jgi:hypothetical protein
LLPRSAARRFMPVHDASAGSAFPQRQFGLGTRPHLDRRWPHRLGAADCAGNMGPRPTPLASLGRLSVEFQLLAHSVSDRRSRSGLRPCGSEVRIPSAPPSSPDKQWWFPDLRKSTPFQWLGGTKRSVRSRFLSFAPAERLERASVSSDKNSVSQIDGCLFRKAAGSVKRYSDIAIL